MDLEELNVHHSASQCVTAPQCKLGKLVVIILSLIIIIIIILSLIIIVIIIIIIILSLIIIVIITKMSSNLRSMDDMMTSGTMQTSQEFPLHSNPLHSNPNSRGP